MRNNDDRNQLTDDFARELLDAALTNCPRAEPRAGLEERVLDNLCQQPRSARFTSWNVAPVMIATVAMLIIFVADHLMNHSTMSESAAVRLSEAGEKRGGIESKAIAQVGAANQLEVATDKEKLTKTFAGSMPVQSSPRRRGVALKPNPERAEEPAAGSIRVEDLKISEVRLDEIVLSKNEQ
jgi:hypothetical protein